MGSGLAPRIGSLGEMAGRAMARPGAAGWEESPGGGSLPFKECGRDRPRGLGTGAPARIRARTLHDGLMAL